jgi:hypothetical protein
MYSLEKTTRTIILIGAFALAAMPSQAVSPPPDGGYPNQNTAEGEDPLFSLTTGTDNTALGYHALFIDATSSSNTAVGSTALAGNTSGRENTALGRSALFSNTTGNGNVAIGFSSLVNNTAGSYNIAVGNASLNNHTSGNLNVALGHFAMRDDSDGDDNVAVGYTAMIANISGNRNTAVGNYALQSNTTGEANICIGIFAGRDLTTGSNNIDIGNVGKASESKTIRIGNKTTQRNTYIAGVDGVTVAGGVGVIIDTDGHLGTVTSSERYKEQIKPMDKSSEAILSLKPVTFRYKKRLDPKGIHQFGLVAEQVEKVNPDLVARDDQGKPYTVRYEAVNAMLLNEFLKEHRGVQELKTTVAQQRAQIEALMEAVKAQTAQIQKVSDQLTMQAAAPRVVVNN